MINYFNNLKIVDSRNTFHGLLHKKMLVIIFVRAWYSYYYTLQENCCAQCVYEAHNEKILYRTVIIFFSKVVNNGVLLYFNYYEHESLIKYVGLAIFD